MTDDEVKTRAQKELLSEIVKGVEPEENNGKEEVVAGEEDSERPKVTRKGTMAVTAEVCGGCGTYKVFVLKVFPHKGAVYFEEFVECWLNVTKVVYWMYGHVGAGALPLRAHCVLWLE